MQVSEKIQRAVLEMNVPLRNKYETIRDLSSNNTAEIVRARHTIGRMILEIRNDVEKYGARAVPLLATALGRDETTLYRYGQVAARWNAADLAKLLKRTDVYGEPLSWSHLVELTAIHLKRERERWTEKILTEGLSVRELARAVGGLHSGMIDESDAGAKPSLATSLKEIVVMTDKLNRRAARWDDAMFAPAQEPTSKECTLEIIDLLDRATTAQATLLDTCRSNLQRLERVKSRVNALGFKKVGSPGKTRAPRASIGYAFEGKPAP